MHMHVYHDANFDVIGILAGMWPCGIITFLNELFTSESKSQVYGQLHEFLRIAPLPATNLSKFWHYVVVKA